MRLRLQNSVWRVLFKAYLASDHVTPATGKTIAVTLLKEGGSFANPNAGASNATEIANGWYYFVPAAQDRDTLGTLIWRGTEGTIDPSESEEFVYTVLSANVKQINDTGVIGVGTNINKWRA